MILNLTNIFSLDLIFSQQCYSRQNWTKSGMCGYKSQLCIEELSGSQVNSQLRFNYLMALCETATNDPKWGSLSLFISFGARQNENFASFSGRISQKVSSRRTSHFIVPDERSFALQKLELKIDPFAARAKMHLAVAWFVLHWRITMVASTYLLFTLQTPALRSMREKEMLFPYTACAAIRKKCRRVIIDICCLLKGCGARRYRMYIHSSAPPVDG